jgi:type I restriction enzyme, S subunit
LGDVPGHWDVKRLKRLVHVSGGMTPDKSEPDFWDGDMPWVTAKDMKSLRLADSEDHVSPSALRATGLKPVTPPASLIVVRGMILAHTFPVAEIDAPVTINQDMKALRPAADLAPGYLAWMLRGSSGYVLSIADESAHGTKALRTDRLFEMQIPLPPADEQCAIAAFLDRETARIDALVAAKRRLIALLQEKRAALIARAVTRGLDPEAPTKDSGVAWLGRVPAHWRVGKCGHYMSVLSGFAFPSSGFSANESDTRLLRGVNVGVSRVRWDDVVYWERLPGDGLDTYELREGDIVIGMDRPLIGEGVRVARLQPTDAPCLLLQRVAKLQPGPRLLGEYLMQLLSSPMFVPHFSPDTTGVSVPHISPEQIGSFVVPIPPMPEQAAIAELLTVQGAHVERAIAAVQQGLDRLTEYRSTLITSAVTGRIDVRAA